MTELHIIMPMAGRGSRFAKTGVKTPKPLIEVDGQAMFLKALSSLDSLAVEKELTVIIRAEHDQANSFSNLLRQARPGINIVKTSDQPVGSAADAIKAAPHLKPEQAVIVMDCDVWFESASFNKMVESVARGGSDLAGGLLTFAADNPRYSYAELAADDTVIRTAEKQVISQNAITGAYFFASAQIFEQAVRELMQKPITAEMPEYYMSLLYNVLINDGKKIKATFVDSYASFGTPEELADYQANRTV